MKHYVLGLPSLATALIILSFDRLLDTQNLRNKQKIAKYLTNN